MPPKKSTENSSSESIKWLEVARLQDKMEAVQDNLKKVEEKANTPHSCFQTGVFEAIQAMITSNKRDIETNAASIKKLYTWQATVGISLLVFFLTVGVAALRYVDKINFAVEQNKANIVRIEKENKESNLSKEELKKILKNTLKDK